MNFKKIADTSFNGLNNKFFIRIVCDKWFYINLMGQAKKQVVF